MLLLIFIGIISAIELKSCIKTFDFYEGFGRRSCDYQMDRVMNTWVNDKNVNVISMNYHHSKDGKHGSIHYLHHECYYN